MLAEVRCDHDWSPEWDWWGDPDVPGGTQTWRVYRCHRCGAECGEAPFPNSGPDWSDDDDAG